MAQGDSALWVQTDVLTELPPHRLGGTVLNQSLPGAPILSLAPVLVPLVAKEPGWWDPASWEGNVEHKVSCPRLVCHMGV